MCVCTSIMRNNSTLGVCRIHGSQLAPGIFVAYEVIFGILSLFCLGGTVLVLLLHNRKRKFKPDLMNVQFTLLCILGIGEFFRYIIKLVTNIPKSI